MWARNCDVFGQSRLYSRVVTLTEEVVCHTAATLAVVVGLLFFSLTLIAGDRDSGQRAAQVPGIVSGAYGNRIVPAILIIPSARGLQGNGEAIPAVWIWPYSSIT